MAPSPTTTSVRRSKVRSRPYHHRRCKLTSTTRIESLPDDLLSEILVRVPADVLHKRARLVCRRWSLIISSAAFVNAHLHRSSYGLVLHKIGGMHQIYLSATEQGQIEVSRLSCSYLARGSCNGVVADFLTRRLISSRLILNPATKKEFILPEVGSTFLYQMFCGVAYSAASMEYKVVQLRPESDQGRPDIPYLDILTVGVDNSWRQLQVEHIPDNLRPLFAAEAVVTEGFIHWGAWDTGILLTLNVETEIITQTSAPLPAGAPPYLRKFCYLSTGRHLSLLRRSRSIDLMWEVWEMKPDTGEWRKCRDFQFASNQIDKGRSCFKIFGWVKFPDVLACLSSSDSLIFYNLNTHEFEYAKLPRRGTQYHAFMHKNTLLWLS